MEKHLVHQKSYRYEILNDVKNPSDLLIVLHGYGQLAKYFIRKFNGLDLENTLVVAPEGMHRFYLKGSSGRVGASWMTKEDRETDIRDNNSWLDQLYTHLQQEYKFSRSHILGFSQGGATATRWFEHSKFQHASLLIWASVFPPDMVNQVKTSNSPPNRYFILGDSDVYFQHIESTKVQEEYERLNFEVINYSGGHDIEIDVLKAIIPKIIS